LSTRASIFYSSVEEEGCLHIYREMMDGKVHVEYVDGANYLDFSCSEAMSEAVIADFKKLSGK
jgi:hypothetical protein